MVGTIGKIDGITAGSAAPAREVESTHAGPPIYDPAGAWKHRATWGAAGAVGGLGMGLVGYPVVGWFLQYRDGLPPRGIAAVFGVAALAGLAAGIWMGSQEHRLEFERGPLADYYFSTGVSKHDVATSLVQAHDRDGDGELDLAREGRLVRPEALPMQAPGIYPDVAVPGTVVNSHLWRTADGRDDRNGVATSAEVAGVLSEFDSDLDGRLQSPEFRRVLSQYF